MNYGNLKQKRTVKIEIFIIIISNVTIWSSFSILGLIFKNSLNKILNKILF